MGYQRVIPRDLFNEAKLLKCMGQLALILHDHPGRYPLAIGRWDPGSSFAVEQDKDSGDLYVSNIHVWRLPCYQEVSLRCCYNSREPYPLTFYTDQYGYGDVFNDDGSFSGEFLDFIEYKGE